MTALEIVREVQARLRLPQSEGLTDPHALLMLSLANQVQRSLMLDATVWDELKRYGTVLFTPDTDTFAITLTTNDEIELIRAIYYSASEPVEKLDDDDFRQIKRRLNTGKPQYYRHYARQGKDIIIEVIPQPDQVYEAHLELIQKPPRLLNATDVPLLDADAIMQGALMLARAEQGEDIGVELEAFRAKSGLLASNANESNWGDLEPV